MTKPDGAPALAAAGGATQSLFPTDNGHFYTVAQSAQLSRGDQPTTITWTKMSPEGEVLASGEWSNPTALTSLGGAFPLANGVGVALNRRLVRGVEALERDLMWAERVDPASAQRLATEAAAPERTSTPRAQPRPRATPEPAAPPTLELPKPGAGCACTCEEFAEIQAMSERMKSASQAEMLAMVSDPAFQARMNCMSGCAMAYAQCR